MTELSRRYAIYFAPPEDSPLHRLASAWLGRSSEVNAMRGEFSVQEWQAATADPRIYGFHATLKPPFRLASGTTEEQLVETVRAFAATHHAFIAPPLRVSSLSSFLAMTLSQPCPAFEELAADCVRDFDRFRAPASEGELARRKRARLNAAQLEHLDRWGYPYVMEEWRFHMTLTGSPGPGLFDNMGAHLRDLFAIHCREPLAVDSICLFTQPAAAEPFHVKERFALR
jgi:putative phosphonate metabolism protein